MIYNIFIFSLVSSAFATIKDCNSNSLFRPTHLELYPDPPIPGQPFFLTLVFDNTDVEYNDGIVITTLSINSVPLPTDKKPLCDSTSCPIIPGINNRSTETIWPKITGVIKSKVVWTGLSKEQLLCIDTNFKVPSGIFWNIFSSVQNVYHKNKYSILNEFNKFKSMAEKNHLRGIINNLNTWILTDN